MEFSAYFRFVAALVFVLGMIGVLALVARHFIPGARNINRRNKERRVSIVEVVPVDTKRRLVLFKRDDTEHLVLLGPAGDCVIERNIGTHFSEVLSDDMRIHGDDNLPDAAPTSDTDTNPTKINGKQPA
ncbi:FliO/MopB family protein [Thalassospira xianhensis]|uniref:Flagellar assembly protein FliO n=1 Tax=Thalassospira xianhensis MCCC 1A02616 TaxID=1177929 RepID=A0A367UCQ1_9PROT|nr:flagellar biosynthetic protein FliO [Thalassospira xianhensis]RCK06086.1 flagellar assembly protein FliO [Thalassospira xianhensis MCCC 1A02616]